MLKIRQLSTDWSVHIFVYPGEVFIGAAVGTDSAIAHPLLEVQPIQTKCQGSRDLKACCSVSADDSLN